MVERKSSSKRVSETTSQY